MRWAVVLVFTNYGTNEWVVELFDMENFELTVRHINCLVNQFVTVDDVEIYPNTRRNLIITFFQCILMLNKCKILLKYLLIAFIMIVSYMLSYENH